MGRVLLTIIDGKGKANSRTHTESLKCKSSERAAEIAKSRPNCIAHQYFGDNDIIPRPRKVKQPKREMTLEEMEKMLGISMLKGFPIKI